VPRHPTTDANAESAVAAFVADLQSRSASLSDAWLSICRLLLTCSIWSGRTWAPLHGQPVLRESNDYKLTQAGVPNTALQEATLIGDYIASQMRIPRTDLASHVGQFLMSLGIQPNNPRGHAFRSIMAELLARYGDQDLVIEEEVDPYPLFPGFTFSLRSAKPRIDIIVYRGTQIVALCSTRWTYRHDRVDMLEEAVNYMAAARRVNQWCKFFGITAEVNPARLKKVVSQTAPVNPHSAIERLVHLHVPLATSVIGHDASLRHLWDIVDWVKDSPNWR
jgi:hypothetical protein